MEYALTLDRSMNWLDLVETRVSNFLDSLEEKSEKYFRPLSNFIRKIDDYSRPIAEHIYGKSLMPETDFSSYSEHIESNDHLLSYEKKDISSVWKGHQKIEDLVLQMNKLRTRDVGVYVDYRIDRGDAKINVNLNSELPKGCEDYKEQVSEIKDDLDNLFRQIKKSRKGMNQSQRIQALSELEYSVGEEVVVEYFKDGKSHKFSGRLKSIDGNSNIVIGGRGGKTEIDFLSKTGGIKSITRKSPSESGEGSVLLYHNQWVSQSNSLSYSILVKNSFG